MMRTEHPPLLAGAFVYAVSLVFLSMRGLLVLPFLTDALGAAEYGAFAQLSAAVGLLTPVLSLRLDTASVRFLASESEPTRFRNGFAAPLVLLLVLGLSTCALAYVADEPISAALLGTRAHADLIVATGPWLMSSVLSQYLLNYFRIVSRIATLSWLRTLQVVASTTALLVVVHRGEGLANAILALALADGVFCLFYSIVVGRAIRAPGRFALTALRSWLRYSVPLVPNNLLLWATAYADRLFLVHYWGATAIASYAVSDYLAESLGFLTAPLNFVLFPYLTRLHERQRHDEVRAVTSTTLKVLILLGTPGAVGVALLGPSVMLLLSGGSVAGSMSVLLLLAAASLMRGLTQIAFFAFHLAHQTHRTTFVLLAGAPLNLVLNALLVRDHGLVGAALGTTASCLLVTVLALRSAHRIIPYEVPVGYVVRVLASAATMGAAIHLFRPRSLLDLAIAVVLGVGIYAATAFVSGALSRKELEAIRPHLSNAGRAQPGGH